MQLSDFFRNNKLTITRSRNVLPNVRLAYSRKLLISKFEIDLVLDIGANRGQWALELLNAGYKQMCVSFEPTREAFKDLEKNASEFRNWHVMNVAVGAENTEKILNVAGNNQLSSSFFDMEQSHLDAAPESRFVTKESVQMIRLDSWVSKSKRIFIKIDTQGYEMNILNAIPEEFWRNISIIEMEVSLIKTYDQPFLIEDHLIFLRRKGYKPFRIENGLASKAFGQQLQVDIIFIRKELDF